MLQRPVFVNLAEKSVPLFEIIPQNKVLIFKYDFFGMGTFFYFLSNMYMSTYQLRFFY